MTIKFLDNKNFHFQNLVVVAFPTKNSVLDNFPPCPPAHPPPPEKRKFYFYCRLAFSESKWNGLIFRNHVFKAVVTCALLFLIHGLTIHTANLNDCARHCVSKMQSIQTIYKLPSLGQIIQSMFSNPKNVHQKPTLPNISKQKGTACTNRTRKGNCAWTNAETQPSHK